MRGLNKTKQYIIIQGKEKREEITRDYGLITNGLNLTGNNETANQV